MYRKPKKGYNKSVYRAFVLIMQFGINMLVPICMLSALGSFLDKKLGTSFIMILLFFVGAIAGAQNVYRMAKHVYGPGNKDKQGKNKKEQDKDHENR